MLQRGAQARAGEEREREMEAQRRVRVWIRRQATLFSSLATTIVGPEPKKRGVGGDGVKWLHGGAVVPP